MCAEQLKNVCGLDDDDDLLLLDVCFSMNTDRKLCFMYAFNTWNGIERT